MFGQGSVREYRGYRFIANVGLNPRQQIEHWSQQDVRPGQEQTTPECDIENGLRDQRGAPHRWIVNTRDEDLPRRKLQQVAPAAVTKGWHQTLRYKDDPLPCARGGMCDRIVITDGAFPGLENSNPVEHLASQRHRTSPRKISPMFAERRHNRSIPRRSKEIRQAAIFRGIPAIPRGNADTLILKGRDEPVDPLPGKAGVGVAEYEDFGIARSFRNSVNQVVNLLAAL